jgi:phosphoribosylanthranilate isomerase
MSAASSIWVKICGNTSLEDARLAAEADANAVGFVFAPSPRRVTSEQVAAITPHLPPELEKIGIFVDAAFDEIASIIGASGLTGVQLHCHGAPDLPARLRARFGPNLRILSVVHFGAGAADKARAIAADPSIDAILVDSRTATAVGGTGLTFDWESAGQTLFREAAAQKPMVAAGGLSPLNVAEAIAALHPWGVDVVSGVEAAPGRKDPVKVRDFVARARACAFDLNRV